MKKIMNTKQYTIIWHVDDLNMSHVDPDSVSSVLVDIDQEYGNSAKMTTTLGKINTNLGMTITTPHQVKYYSLWLTTLER